jgi:hypothetical protein
MEDSEIKLYERVTLTLKLSWRPVNFRDQSNIRQTDIVVKQMSVQGITSASATDRRLNYYPPPPAVAYIYPGASPGFEPWFFRFAVAIKAYLRRS